ncbi:MAG: lipocalin family protein [Bacteriovoracaceae bacterium]
MKLTFSLLLLALTLNFSFAKGELRTASHVDVERYLGKWYTISSLPQFFTRKCVAQTADYDLINAQTISVLNTCIKANGSTTTINGQAVIVNAQTNAELEVTFNSFWTRLFRVKGDYTIVKLDPEYQYVLVASKNRKSMWILSRTKTMPESIYNEYVAEAKSQGFAVEKLEFSKF